MNVQGARVPLNYYFITSQVCFTLKLLADLLKVCTNTQEIMVLLVYQPQYMSTSYKMHDDIQDVTLSWIVFKYSRLRIPLN